MNYNSNPTFKYYVTNVFVKGCLNIEDDEHLLYSVKVRSSLSTHLFNNKLQNQLILYLKGQKWNSSNRISKLKEPWTALNLKAVQYILLPNQLYSCCQFLKEVAE